jgi:hypothetical protein
VKRVSQQQQQRVPRREGGAWWCGDAVLPLKPLPPTPYLLAERYLRPVGKDCLIAFGGNLFRDGLQRMQRLGRLSPDADPGTLSRSAGVRSETSPAGAGNTPAPSTEATLGDGYGGCAP